MVDKKANWALQYDLRDPKQVKEYLDKLHIEYGFQCHHERLPEGCHRLGDFFETIRPDVPKAIELYLKNCTDNDFGHSCHKYANHSLLGRYMPKDTKQALEYYKKGCLAKKEQYAGACYQAGQILEHGWLDGRQRCGEALDWYTRACDTGDGEGCLLQGTLLLQGRDDVTQDLPRAHAVFRHGCDRYEDIPCCHNVARMYRLGEGVEKDLAMAKTYRKQFEKLKRRVTHPHHVQFGQ